MIRVIGIALALMASAAMAQQEGFAIDSGLKTRRGDITGENWDDRPGFESVSREAAEPANGAVLRALDRVSGEVEELSLRNGGRATMGLIEISLGECRYPAGNPTGDAFAWVEVRTPGRGSTDFQGWMIASSPALNALDHPRYDVWVMRCTNV